MKTTKATSRILADIEIRLTGEQIDPMRCDPWLAASAMQKAIRRGETERGLQAAIALWQQDKARFWRRLHITALEDVGPANTVAVIETLKACAHSRWRKQAGDLQVGLALVRSLCTATKCRMADYVYIAAERGTEYAKLRTSLAKSSTSTLTEMALNMEASVIERLLALWLVAGTKRYPSEYLPRREGSLEAAIGIVRDIYAPTSLIAACEGVMMKTSWPLALFMPLLWAETQNHHTIVKTTALTTCPDVGGVPFYAVDWFTRTGRSSIGQLQRSIPAFKRFTGQQIGLAAFYLEGGLVDKELTAPALEAFKQEGEVADIESAGLDVPHYLGLRELMKEHWPRFNDIRTNQLKRYHDASAY